MFSFQNHPKVSIFDFGASDFGVVFAGPLRKVGGSSSSASGEVLKKNFKLTIQEKHSYPVILRILGFQTAPHLVGKYIIPGSLAPPISQGFLPN